MITKNLNELEQLRLSARVRRFLDDRGIHTVDQLCSLSVHSVLTGPSMGSAEVIQIAGELAHVGRKWPTDSSSQAGERRACMNNELSLMLHALFAASAGDTVEIEMVVAGQTVNRYDLLGLFRAEAEECESASRANHLRYSANDLRRIADILDQLASAEPTKA